MTSNAGSSPAIAATLTWPRRPPLQGVQAMGMGEEILAMFRAGKLTKAILERYSTSGYHQEELARIKGELKRIVYRCFYAMPGRLTDDDLSLLQYREWFSDGGGI